jgi:hypothetical protein
MTYSLRWKRALAMGVVAVTLALAGPRAKREIFGDRCSGYGWGLASVIVRAVDAPTGRPLSKELQWQSVLIVRDGDFVDSTSLARGAAYERAGVYDVTVRAPGYREWTRRGVRVREGLCDLKRARLKARLSRVDR